MKKLCHIVLLLLLAGGAACAQTAPSTNMGRDFWMMFLPNTGGTHQLPDDTCSLIAVGPTDATVTVESQDHTATFHLNGGGKAVHVCGSNEEVRGRAYHVTASADIALFARNAIFVSHEVAMIVPTRCLGTEYIAQSATAAQGDTEMLGFLATEDSTVITIDFHNWLGNRQVPSDIEVPDDGLLHIPLQRGETYILGTQQPLSNALYTWGYFSGKTITSNGRPFAMFQGNSAAHVPITDNYRGTHLYEQAIPLSQWGHTYLLGGVGEQQHYYAHVTSGDDSNRMHHQDSYTYTMSRGEIISNQQTPLSSNVASQPYYFSGRTGVSLLMSSYGASGFCGGPASVTVPSVEHGVREAWFTAEQYVDYQDNYLTIFCDTLCAGGLRLDGQLLSLSSTFPPNWDPEIQPYHTAVGIGPHHLEIDSGTFVAILYGLRNGTADSYANAVGMALDPYPRDTLTRADTVCVLAPYHWGPFHYADGELAASGTYNLEGKLFDPDTVHVYHLALTVLPSFETVLYDTLAPDDTLHIADTVIANTGTYTFHLTATNGCDSSVTLHLASCMAPPCVSLSRPYIDFDHPVVTFTDCTEGSVLSQWLFGDGSVYTGSPLRRQFHQPLPDSMEVTLRTCNRRGCCADTTFSIGTRVLDVWFPNVFTPDAGDNNRFRAVTTVEPIEFELTVYDRRGQVLFSTTDPKASWDGTSGGTPLPQGSYVYHWFMRDAHDYRRNGAGTITLLR